MEGKQSTPDLDNLLQQFAKTPLVPGQKPSQEVVYEIFENINNAATSKTSSNEKSVKGTEEK